ncbi:uncharacterized protein ATC70_000511 [Mucor velutinosus]|uniref:CCHC-type domain-containing protein n=1 Tax=Mucor velutinosus TaxID=708070 RepID=A0AAN7DIS4_9FUNG|nr:hypothetical protein ATC70_000511 [Mucor velutinosus]
MTFNPTIVKTPITPPTTTSESNQSLMTEDATVSKSVEMVRPFLQGIEDNSVLIDITSLPNQQLLREALQVFNKGTHLRKGYNDYIGKASRTRKYMNRKIMETCWIHDSPGHTAILQGFNLTDGTFVKGFPSLPANDCHILEKSYGISFTQGDYVGQGYATLNITPKPYEPAYETLDRIIYFRLDNGTNRQVLLKWQDMPDFCRLCQKPDHCKANCPDAKKYTQCYNCNQHGHVSRNCPRQDNTDTPNKKPATIPRKDRKVPTPIIPREPNPPIGPRVVVVKTQETTDTEPAKKQQQQNKPEPTKEEEEGTDEDNMSIDSPTPQPKNNNDGVTPNADAASAQTSDNNTQTLTSPNAAESILSGQELIKQIMPNDNMKEPLIQERPDLEDDRDGKKLRTEQEQRANPTRRFTRGSAASKYNTETDKDDKGASDDSQGQETSETAQSNPQNLE